MNNKRNINSKTEEILNSLDGIRRAAPQPFLYTRVMARLTSPAVLARWETMASFISRPAFAIATIALFLLINVAVVFHFAANTGLSTRDDSTVVTDNEYSLSVSSFYDINPEQNDIAQK